MQGNITQIEHYSVLQSGTISVGLNEKLYSIKLNHKNKPEIIRVNGKYYIELQFYSFPYN